MRERLCHIHHKVVVQIQDDAAVAEEVASEDPSVEPEHREKTAE